jgi:ankyrin repeat protein
MFFGLFGSKKESAAALLAAARSGDVEQLEGLLSQGTSINTQEPVSGDTPLIAAIDRSQWAAAEILLNRHPDLNLQDEYGQTALYLAVCKGDSAISILNLLLAAGADTELGPTKGDNAGASPLHIACVLGANGCVESLLRSRASVKKSLPSGEQPMHTAAIGGNTKTIELLHMAGADLNAVTDELRSPLHNCGITGNANVAAALLRLGAQVDPKDRDGYTPLLHAVTKDKLEVAKTLLNGGADPNVIVQSDDTVFYPLVASSMYGFTKMARLLIEKGGDISLIKGGQYLADVAKLKGHTSTAKLFQSAQDEEVSKSNVQSDLAAPTIDPKPSSNVGAGIRFNRDCPLAPRLLS